MRKSSMAMRLLGMPVGPVRRPLGKMPPSGLETVVDAARKVWTNDPEVFEPLAKAFAVDIEDRLSNPECRRGLCYKD